MFCGRGAALTAVQTLDRVDTQAACNTGVTHTWFCNRLPGCLPQVRWITFHSGYDFGYLLRVLTCSPLPASEAEFFELLKVGGWALGGGM